MVSVVGLHMAIQAGCRKKNEKKMIGLKNCPFPSLSCLFCYFPMICFTYSKGQEAQGSSQKSFLD